MWVHICCLRTGRFTFQSRWFCWAYFSTSAGRYYIFQWVSLLFGTSERTRKKKIKGLLNGMVSPKSFTSVLSFPALPSFVTSCIIRVCKAEKNHLEYSDFSSESWRESCSTMGARQTCLSRRPSHAPGTVGCPSVRVLKPLCKLGKSKCPPWLLLSPRCTSAMSWGFGVVGEVKLSGFWPHPLWEISAASKTSSCKNFTCKPKTNEFTFHCGFRLQT